MPTAGVIDRLDLSLDNESLVVVQGVDNESQALRYDLGDPGNGEPLGRPHPTQWWSAITVSADGRTIGGPGFPGLITDVAGRVLAELAECERPSALNADGALAVISIGTTCQQPVGAQLVDVRSASVLKKWDFWVADADFGPFGTPAEGWMALNNGLVELVIERIDGSGIGRWDTSEIVIFGPNFSSDGRWLSFGSQKGGGFVLDVEMLSTGLTIEESIAFNQFVVGGPTNLVRTEAGLVVTAHTDLLRVWDLESEEQWFDLPTGYGNLASADFSSNGRYLYYSGEGGSIRRMPLDVLELTGLAESRVNRGFTLEECERFLIDTDCSVYEET